MTPAVIGITLIVIVALVGLAARLSQCRPKQPIQLSEVEADTLRTMLRSMAELRKDKARIMSLQNEIVGGLQRANNSITALISAVQNNMVDPVSIRDNLSSLSAAVDSIDALTKQLNATPADPAPVAPPA